MCRPWRALLSDPQFAAAHSARHPGPLIVAGYAENEGDGMIVDIMDLSGQIVKRVRRVEGRDRVMSIELDLAFVKNGSSMSCHVLNVTTGSIHVLPEGLATEHAKHKQTSAHCWATTAIGMVPSTGEYKVLRVIHTSCSDDLPTGKLFEAITIDGSSSQAHWRGKGAPPYPVELGNWHSVVIKHTVYFLLSDYGSFHVGKRGGLVASFDLESEKWGESIPGPLSSFIARRNLTCFDLKIAALVNA
ncbi:hypothetical protein HU200_013634 [Digitaria exilis]|uniref:Uncharacterized protein n=1 Tax=Digitaria exilis TaxID=1010633 RepID=A0A835KKW6_9POAL|nr:hypothetical protein HU200_013634 [Digitaria exilis]